MDELEKQFYELFEIDPDKMTMAVIIKALDESTNPNNYEEKKREILSEFIKPIGKVLGEALKESVQREWAKVKEDTYKMYHNNILNLSNNN